MIIIKQSKKSHTPGHKCNLQNAGIEECTCGFIL